MGDLRPQAFFWTDGAPAIALGNLGGRATDSSLARAVSDDGTVVGWSGEELWGDQEAFIWTRENRMLSLAVYLGSRGVELPEGMVLTAALDISGDGNTMVGLAGTRTGNTAIGSPGWEKPTSRCRGPGKPLGAQTHGS